MDYTPIPYVNQFVLNKLTSYSRTIQNGCIIWVGSRDKDGYGKICVQRISFRVHRVAYFTYYGIDPKELLVCHTCNNPSCVNVEHLYLGNQLQNQQQSISEGRSVKNLGESNGQHKLTREKVIQIRKLASFGVSQTSISKQYKVRQSVISDIVLNKLWKEE